tara:strand:- start:189 stop:443 length:255 start_codon:yes stop_codon:yes gene_type:complete
MINNLKGDSDKNKNQSVKKVNFSIGFKMATDFVASIFVGGLIGVGCDKFFSSKPIFFLIFLILGIAGAFLNIYRTILKLEEKGK